MKVRFVVTLFLLLVSKLSIAITYYISPTGNNSNTGNSPLKPWQTISAVNLKNFNGDTILFLGGMTFNGSLYFTSADAGTPTKPIVIGSYGTGRATIYSDSSYGIYVENAGGFKLKNLIFKGSGISTNKKSGIIFYTDKDSFALLKYIFIDSTEVFGYQQYGISIGSWKYRTGYRDVTVKNCYSHDNGIAGISMYAEKPYVHKKVYIGRNIVYNNPGLPEKTSGNSGNGIVLGNVDTAVIEYCTAYENGILHKNTIDGGPNGIWAYESNYVIMQYNESHHNKSGTAKDGGGFDLDGGCTNSIMQYNYSHDNYGVGFVIAQNKGGSATTNNTIRYNISENDCRKQNYGAIQLWSAGSNGGIKNVHIYNNIIFLKPAPGYSPKGFYLKSSFITGVTVRNNIFQTTGGVEVLNLIYTSGCTFQGNNYWSTGGSFKIKWGATTYTSLAAWRTATTQEKVNGIASGFQVDPQYSDTTRGKTFNDATKLTTLKSYKIKSTSALYNTGLNLKTLFGTNIGSRDFWGNSLSGKTKFHVGAYQFVPVTTSGSIINDAVTLNLISDPSVSTTSIKVLPNPVTTYMKILYTVPQKGRLLFKVFNVSGQLLSIYSTSVENPSVINSYSINTSELVKGNYFLIMELSGKPLKSIAFVK